MNRNKIRYHGKGGYTRYIHDVAKRETDLNSKDFNCIQGVITGLVMASMFILALFI